MDEYHQHSDVDSSFRSLHHTLGTKEHQAAKGNHKHSDLAALIAGLQGADVALDARLDLLEAITGLLGINAIKYGALSTTLSAGSTAVITHGMGITPIAAFVHSVGTGGTGHFCAQTSLNATDFTTTVRVVTTAGAPGAGAIAVNLRWFAIG